jgi:acetyltransferase
MTIPRTAGLRDTRLLDGRRILIRTLMPEDTKLLSDMGKLCSAQDLRFRFLHTVSTGNEKALRRLTDLDPARAIALVAFYPGDPTPVAMVRLHGEPDGKKAEFAIIVRSDKQGIGLGRVMMRLMIDCAVDRGLRVLEGQVLSDNDRMLKLSKSLGFSRTNGGLGVNDIHLDLDPDKDAEQNVPPAAWAIDTIPPSKTLRRWSPRSIIAMRS